MNQTEKIFPEELTLILATTNLMRRVTSISKNLREEFSRDPRLATIMTLFCRNRELAHFAMVCLMNGGYAPSKVLIRVGLENSLCMRLFVKRGDLAKEWLSNPKRFGKTWFPTKIRDELFPKDSSLEKSYKEFYEELCNYTHPNFKGWSEQFYGKTILWHPVFDPDYASECIGLIFFIMVHSFMQFTTTFRQWLPNNLIAEVNRLLPKDSQMVRRHFRVQKDGKIV
jgi:hypothetical protein